MSVEIEGILCVIGFKYRKNSWLANKIEKCLESIGHLSKTILRETAKKDRELEFLRKSFKTHERKMESFKQQNSFLQNRCLKLNSTILEMSGISNVESDLED